jgi:hypothetical protein
MLRCRFDEAWGFGRMETRVDAGLCMRLYGRAIRPLPKQSKLTPSALDKAFSKPVQDFQRNI